jgi:hypothetical protein
MRLDSSVDTLAASLHSARLVDLAPVSYRQLTVTQRQAGVPEDQAPLAERRPTAEECDVCLFRQVWGSTSLGFGGIGGAAVTAAYTVVVQGPNGDACVYFQGRLAYRVAMMNEAFIDDLSARNMASVHKAGAYNTP